MILTAILKNREAFQILGIECKSISIMISEMISNMISILRLQICLVSIYTAISRECFIGLSMLH